MRPQRRKETGKSKEKGKRIRIGRKEKERIVNGRANVGSGKSAAVNKQS